MAELKSAEGIALRYELSGDESGDWLVLSHSLGQSLGLWDSVVVELEKQFRVLRYDSRGHGASRGVNGAGSPASWAEDVLRLMDEVGAEKAHFCGISIGGQVGLWLGLHHAGRLGKLVLSNTAPKIGEPEFWHERAALARQSGAGQFVPGSKERWLTEEFRNSHPGVGEALEAVVAATTYEGYADGCELLAAMDVWDRLGEIRLPVLCIGSTEDPTTTADTVKRMAASIPDARYAELKTGHLSCVEAAEEWARLAGKFLAD